MKRVLAILNLFAVMPLVAFAQSDAELRATIGGALLEDPAAANLSQAEFEALVDSMVLEAQSRGMTAEDIAFVPAPPASQIPAPVAEAVSGLGAGQKTLLALGALALLFLVLWLLYRWLHEAPRPVHMPPTPPMAPPRPPLSGMPGNTPRY